MQLVLKNNLIGREILKKVASLMLLITLLFIVPACNGKGDSGKDPIDRKQEQSTGGSRPTVKGVKNVDVVNTHGRIFEGLDNMHTFYENVLNGVLSDLRIVHYTIEGDPIVTDLKYDGETMKVINDSTRDKFGSGEIETTKCSGLIEEVTHTNTTYFAVDCSDGHSSMLEILAIDYNVEQEDFFELALKYGNRLENEINTKTQVATRAPNSKETVTTSDFQLSSEVKQEVYKQLVMVNYLGDIELVNNCHSNQFEEYDLQVYINGGEREFHWSSCDESPAGVKFTKIAEYIIAQSEMKE